jgi:hypothetical protein
MEDLSDEAILHITQCCVYFMSPCAINDPGYLRGICSVLAVDEF